MTVLSQVIDGLELLALQKTFYISSIILIWIGIYQAITHRRKKNKVIEKILHLEKSNNVIDLARDPLKKGESVLKIIDIVKIGGKTMNDYLKGFSKLQWFSLVATFSLICLGIASAFLPELAIIADNLGAFLFLIGVVSAPGIASRGKELGEQVKKVVYSKNKIKEINHLVKLAKKELELIEKDYGYLKPILTRQKEYGGTLTADQELAKSNYETQKASVEKRISDLNATITNHMEVIK